MCGISVLISKNERAGLAPIIARMSSLVEHRGPDDEGFAFFSNDFQQLLCAYGDHTPNDIIRSSYAYHPKTHWQPFMDHSFSLAMGHRRLSILDLTPAGHQPMCSDDRNIWISYNGEIYNYLEIRRELEEDGCVFFTQTDTEVIIKSYQKWGVASFNRLNGMFAFVLCDRFEKKILAVRDRFGVKPLYYWISHEGLLAFASEIKQFSAIPKWNPKAHGQRIYDFLNWGTIDHSSDTCFLGVRQLRGGEYLAFSLNETFSQLQPKKWYILNPPPFRGSFQDACQEFRGLLKHSIQLRMRADISLGSCLSGGLDSSSIVCLMHHLLEKKGGENTQKTFSACSHIPHFNEKDFIDLVIEAVEVKANYVYPEASCLFEECQQLTWHQDEPIGSTSIYAQWLVFKEIKEQKLKVILDGQGADEQLAGYAGFFGNRLYELLQQRRWKMLFQELKMCKLLHNTLSPLSMLFSKFIPNAFKQPLKKLFKNEAMPSEWLNVKKLQALDKRPFHQLKNKTVLEQTYEQLLHSSLPMLLHWADRNSMAHSVESRTPFLDYRLVEFCLGLPSDYKISSGWTKRVLRSSMMGILPEAIRFRRDKMGFVTAEEVWLREECPEVFKFHLKRAIECSQGILLPSALRILEEVIQGTRPFSFLPWRLISFGHWIERFNITM